MSYKRILLATDLSKYSHQIAKKAKKMADMHNAKLSIVHIMEHFPVAYGGEFSVPIDIEVEQQLEAIASKELTKLGKKLEVATKDIHLKTGSVQICVTQLAEKIKADLIIAGEHGHEGLKAILGSRATAILHHAHCDVLIARIHPK